jgi:4-diphosphocytidyl-2-C-methyl-D-erythritol kinase
MISFPNCKINIGLRIINKRADGFHDIETVFVPVALKDAIEIIEESSAGKEISYSQSGIKIPGTTEDDLCVKAFHLLKKDFPQIPAIKMHLHKAIPIGSGLGGGSADATFMLKLIDQKFCLGLSQEQLTRYAIKLGSDCPFFVINKPCYGTGRGEILEEISLDLSAYKIILVNPGIHINTGWAFSNVQIEHKAVSLKDQVMHPVSTWQQNITNDFEKPVFEAHPEIAEIKTELIEMGAIYASMSGSGSTLFGILEKRTNPVFNFPAHYFCKWV